MDTTLAWLAACLTGAALLLYDASLALAQRRRPEQVARTARTPAAGPIAAVIVLTVLLSLDKLGSGAGVRGRAAGAKQIFKEYP